MSAKIFMAIQKKMNKLNTSEKDQDNLHRTLKTAEDSLAQQNEALSKLNHFSLELSKLSLEDNLEAFIAKQAKEITGAAVAVFLKYNAVNRTTTVQHIEMEPGLLEKVVGLLGKQIKEIHSVISDEIYRETTTNPFGFRKTLHEASFGVVSRPVGAAIEILLNVDRFIGMAYLIDGKLYGASLLAMRKGQPDPLKNILENFISLATVSLRRKQADENLRQSEVRFRNVIDAAEEYVFEINAHWGFTFLSDRVRDIVGYEPQELIGKTPFDVMVSAEEVARVRALFGEYAAHKRPFRRLEHTCLTKDGRVRTLIVTAQPVVDVFGELAGFQGMAEDITERKQAEEENLKYEHRLQQTQKLESLGVLAGGIAHDFNNILAMIFGYIELAVLKSKDDNITTHLKKSLAAMDRARGLTAQLLTFAKGGAPRQEIGPLFPFVQKTAQFALSGANVSCCFEIPQTLWSSNYDQNQIGQVIDNIVINAQQAMPMGGTIEIAAKNVVLGDKEHMTLPKGNYVKLSIKDDGIGISPNVLPKIFDPFFTTKTKGHGLGLATCFSIINRHGGCIDVESEPGIGSTFHVYLPAFVESALSVPEKPKTEHKGSGTVLVMDDEEDVREVISEMLTDFGYTVVCKENGRDAIDYFIKNRNLVGMIFDLTIPGGMGGVKAIAEIRKLDMKVPVFVASGYAKDTVMANPTDYGFTASIYKPFTFDGLAAMLNTYIVMKKSQ